MPWGLWEVGSDPHITQASCEPLTHPAMPRSLTCPGSHRSQNHFLGKSERSGQCCRAAGIVQQLPMNQGLLSTRWAEAAELGNAPRGCMDTRRVKNPTAGSGASLEAQPSQTVPQRKANQTKNISNMGQGRISRAIFLCSTQLPHAAETKMPLILPTHKKLQQCQALNRAGTTSASNTPHSGCPFFPSSPTPLGQGSPCQQPTLTPSLPPVERVKH